MELLLLPRLSTSLPKCEVVLFTMEANYFIFISMFDLCASELYMAQRLSGRLQHSPAALPIPNVLHGLLPLTSLPLLIRGPNNTSNFIPWCVCLWNMFTSPSSMFPASTVLLSFSYRSRFLMPQRWKHCFMQHYHTEFG